MDLKSGSSSNSRSRTFGGLKFCDCRLPAKIFTAWTDKNPGRRFLGCELYKEGGTAHCKYFRWFDEEEVKGWPKRALIQARDEIREKNNVIDQLSTTIVELRRELEKHEVEKCAEAGDIQQRFEFGWKANILKLFLLALCVWFVRTSLI